MTHLDPFLRLQKRGVRSGITERVMMMMLMRLSQMICYRTGHLRRLPSQGRGGRDRLSVVIKIKIKQK